MPRRLAVSVVLEAPGGFGDVVYLAGDDVPDEVAATVTNEDVWEPDTDTDDDPADRETSPLPVGGARRGRRGGQDQRPEVDEEA